MQHFDRIDVSEGIDVNKTSASKECGTCHYWYFLIKGFKFHSNVCSVFDIAILKMKNADYPCIITGISKSEKNEKMNVINI